VTVLVTVSLSLTAGVIIGAAGVASQTVWFLTAVVFASESFADTVIVSTDEIPPALAARVAVSLSLATLVLSGAAGIVSHAFHRGIFIVDTVLAVTVFPSVSAPALWGAAGVLPEGVALPGLPRGEGEGWTTPQVTAPGHCGGCCGCGCGCGGCGCGGGGGGSCSGCCGGGGCGGSCGGCGGWNIDL